MSRKVQNGYNVSLCGLVKQVMLSVFMSKSCLSKNVYVTVNIDRTQECFGKVG